MVRLAPYLPWWKRQAIALISTTTLVPNSVLALASRSPEDATTVCGKMTLHDKPRDLEYAANAWNPTSEGFQCLTVNEDDTNAWFNAPWLWEGDKDNVHSYPHVKFQSSKLPLPLAEITSMRLTASWMMTAGSLETETPKFSSNEWDENKSSLNELGTVANAAFDMFLDADLTNSTDSVLAGIELMIWIGSVGDPWPLKTKTLGTQKLGDREFTLYYGKNQRDHHVLTWVPHEDVDDITEFDEDVSPLLEYVWRNGLIANSTYLGIVEFGSETWQSSANVTFSTASYSLTINATGASSSGSKISPLPLGCCDLDSSGWSRQRICGRLLLVVSLALWGII
ncbi:concanavalin A-like lectin/glucanase domain-containing protein [Fusarium redolens]|uniref:Concanavalin A-like lectin/glucanase domain-containing protein n=1 Tax=Fusarium redolens TaxID=48865 RepID=A0A9P9FX11_FUSRE|nr:concanavalin A-like lectin/glucanase domain-containing protein [Fusarium redolens]KAH7213227.1 concanavalin A-like lectin/glucanase domain-containing protein [Fusarium redolens]